MIKDIQQIILKSLNADQCTELDKIQDLWSGYGVIKRYGLQGGDVDSVVVKHVRFPKGKEHPRGWNTDLSHNRKVKSYEVETAWYQQWSVLCDETCHVPHCFACESSDDEVVMVLEDLNVSGYSGRRVEVSIDEIKVCLLWLANFHATFMGQKPDQLWSVGTYWHLDTRPDELEVLTDKKMKRAAPIIDAVLKSSPFQTFVHGDAKLANFCFGDGGTRVAAVDFQYVGGGCGMKDVAYFIGSCLYEDECEEYEQPLLYYYFKQLREALKRRNSTVDQDALEDNWRELFPVAWTDFHRFMKGWSPGHWKLNSYSERVSREILNSIGV